MTRAVSVLEVATAALWAELEARVPLDGHLGEALSPTRRVAQPSFEEEVLPVLPEVLVRYARRDPAAVQRVREDLARRVAALPSDVRRVLYAAQRHALDDVVLPTWDPVHDAAAVRALYGAELLRPLDEGRYHLHPDLPPPPEVAHDFGDAVMPPTEDLGAPTAGPVGLLHDLAGLAAALDHVGPRRTHAGTLARADGRRVAHRLGAESLDEDRWARAMRALEGLGAVTTDPITREVHLDLGLEPTLAGTTREAVDRLVHKLLERDLHVVLPAVRAALRQAGDQAVDEVVFLELVREQQRDVIFTPWLRDGVPVYPQTEAPFDEEGFEKVETAMIRRVLSRLERLGVIRRAPGVFAATGDGRRWAGDDTAQTPPIWVSSDLEVIVPPYALTPWERFQVERLSRCLGRDVVDRYRLERAGLRRWLATHDVEEALDLLRRRCPGVPSTVVETLTEWARSAQRVVLTRGVLLE